MDSKTLDELEVPKRIWLQWNGDEQPPYFGDDPPRHEDVTWCQDKIHDGDVEYIRADAAARERDRLREALDQAVAWSGRDMFDPRVHTVDATDNPALAEYLLARQALQEDPA